MNEAKKMFAVHLSQAKIYTCPKSGLETIQFPSWSIDIAGEPYTLSIRVISGRIIHVQSSGTHSPAAIRQKFHIIESVRASCIP